MTNVKLSEAIKAVFENDATIRRKSWDKVNMVAMSNGTLCILFEDGELHPWTISDVDINADDWEIL